MKFSFHTNDFVRINAEFPVLASIAILATLAFCPAVCRAQQAAGEVVATPLHRPAGLHRLHVQPALQTTIPYAGLEVLPASGVLAGTLSDASFDMGKTDVSRIKSVDVPFTLRNDTAQAITITRLVASCQCTTAAIGHAPVSSSSPVTIAPGAKVTVNLHVDLSQLGGTTLSKSVLVYTSSASAPVARLNVTGALVRPSASPQPRSSSRAATVQSTQ